MTARLGLALLALATTIGCSLIEPEVCETWARPSNLDVAGTTAALLGIERDIVAGAGATVVVEGQVQSMPSGGGGGDTWCCGGPPRPSSKRSKAFAA
jgi:hypothetical protein